MKNEFLAHFKTDSSLGFCVESFIPESDVLRVPTYDATLEKFRTKFRCITVEVDQLKGFDSETYLRLHDFAVPWDILERMHINFTVATITYRKMGPLVGKVTPMSLPYRD